MHYDKSKVIYGWSCMGKVLTEILMICAIWVGAAFLPPDFQATGIEIAWLATALAAGSACWKAGFTSIALVMMGVIAMAFGVGYGYVFFALAGLAALGTAISVQIRRRRELVSGDTERRARERLRRFREGEPSVGASLRRGHAVTSSPSRSAAPSSANGCGSGRGDFSATPLFLNGGSDVFTSDSSGCDAGSDGGGSGCGGD